MEHGGHSRAGGCVGWKWLCPQVTAATFFSSAEVRLSCPGQAQSSDTFSSSGPVKVTMLVGSRGWTSPQSVGRDIRGQLPTCMDWLSGLLLENAVWGDVKIRKSVHGGSPPLLVSVTGKGTFLPLAPALSLWSFPGPEQVEVAKNGEFLVHWKF